MQRIAWALLFCLHILPALALIRPALLARLYGVSSEGPVGLLLQHRAAMFVAIAGLCLLALFDHNSRRPAALAAATSMISFLFLYGFGGAPRSLRGIASADAIGLPALAYVIWANFLADSGQ